MTGSRLSLYFASQGAGRLLWPLIANLTRLAIARSAGWLALRSSGNLSYVFLAQKPGAGRLWIDQRSPIAGGSWFGAADLAVAPRCGIVTAVKMPRRCDTLP